MGRTPAWMKANSVGELKKYKKNPTEFDKGMVRHTHPTEAYTRKMKKLQIW